MALAALEKDLHQHIHLENNILFPRAVEMEPIAEATVVGLREVAKIGQRPGVNQSRTVRIMGEHVVEQGLDEQKEQMFMKALLDDLRALDYMLDNDLIESDVRRIGAEQEMFLVDENLRPAPVSVEVLKHANDPRLTTEIARFNLEANLTPLSLSGNCFSQMESELNEVHGPSAGRVPTHFGADILLSGILPTLRKSDLTLENLTPAPRYQQLK